MLKNKQINEVLMYVSRTYPNFHTAKQIAHALHIQNVREVSSILSRCNCIISKKTRKYNVYTLKGKYEKPLVQKIRICNNQKKMFRIMAVISNAYPNFVTSDDISKSVNMTPLQIGGLLRDVRCIEYGKKGHLKTYKLITKWSD